MLADYRRDIREILPEILKGIPAKTIQESLSRSRRHAFSLRNGERKPSKKMLPKVILLAAETAQGILGEMGEPRIPAEDENAIKLAGFRLRNSPDLWP